MLHKPAAPSGADPASGYKSKLGVRMFLVYMLVYAGFVAINVIAPTLMDTPIVFGLNLAVAYGMILIVFALILALVYNRLCSAQERTMGARRQTRKKER